jgi:hypothetical protein
LQDAPTSYDSPPSPREDVSPTTNISTNDTQKEKKEYAKVIENFLHLPTRG